MNTPRLLLTASALLAAVASHAAPFGDASPNALRYQDPTPRAASSLARPLAAPSASTAAGDSTLILGNGFDLLTGTACDPRGWVGEDRSTAVYAHVWNSYLVNSSLFSPELATGAEPLPNAANKTALVEGGAIIKTDTSGVIIADFVGGANSIPRLVSAYPGQNVAREYSYTSMRRIFDADFDPITKGFISSNANGGYIQLIPAGATAGIDLAGKGDVGSPGDTIGAEAYIKPLQIAVRANGDIYFRDTQNERLRMLRRNDLRVITIANHAAGRPVSGDFTQLVFNDIQGLSFGEAENILYVHDTGTIVRLDLNAQTFTTTFGPDARLIGTRFEYSAGSFYWASQGSTQVYRLRAGEISLVLGQPFNGQPIFGDAAGAALGSRTRLYDTIGGFGLDSDDAGGVYVALGQAAYHLLADGTVEPLVGRFTSMRMGNHALCFGADSASAPNEVRNWVQPIGFGNDWSQRATSPLLSLSGSSSLKITLDAVLQLEGTFPSLSGPQTGNLLALQMLDASGQWVSLNLRSTASSLDNPDSTQTYPVADGSGMFRFEAIVDALTGFGPSTRLRVVVNTNGNGSAEDGTTAAVAAAIVDNILVSNGTSTLLSTDFEDGGLQGWSLSARNHKSFQPGVQEYFIHDEPSGAVPRVTNGFDFTDPTCVWNFTDPGTGLYTPYVLARLTSPWIALPSPSTATQIAFSGKLANRNQARNVVPWLRVKRAGQTRPAASRPAFFTLNSGVDGADAVTPFTNQFTMNFPTDFQGAVLGEADSIQIVWQIEDHYDRVIAGNQSVFERDSKFPYLDDFHVYQIGIDADADGIPDAFDGCVAASSAGQDADGDGCVDATSTMKHVESWDAGDLPVPYSISEQGSPAITDGSDLVELANAAATWNSVAFADPPLLSAGTTSQTNASATDGINLITFEDPDFSFPPGVLAVTPTLSFTRQMQFGDRLVRPGQIVDADLILNPSINFRTPSHPGSFDLRSVLVHELGHMVGLSHSGALDASMFFVLQPGQEAATLTGDDEAALAAAYPNGGFATQRATILGTVRRGSNNQPIPGALVSAVRVDGSGAPLDTVGTDYTRTDGSYALRGLPAGTYAVRLTPLNGDVGGYPLTAEAISDRLAATAESNFQPEWRSNPETNSDDADAKEILTLSNGQTASAIDILSNIDVTAPAVVSVAPGSLSNVRIDTSVLLTFSEAINDGTLGSAFKLRVQGTNGTLGGNGVITNAGRTFIFTPNAPLEFGTDYEIALTTALTDREGVPLAAPYSSRFTTETQPAVAITDVQPRTSTPGTFLTVYGAGFSTSAQPFERPFLVFMRNGGAPDTVNAIQVTPNSFLAQVPLLNALGTGFTLTGEVKIFQNGDVSNSFTLTFLPSSPATAPAPIGGTISLGFAPSDAAIAPDGKSAIAVGNDALATVILDPQAPGARVPVLRPITGGSQIVLSPDGRRGYLVRPAHHDVIEIDADAASGTYGSPRDTVELEGSPNGIALTQSGLKAYVTLQDTQQLVIIDTDPGSVTRGQVRATFPLGRTPLGGLAVDAVGDFVYFTGGGGLCRLYTINGSVAATPVPLAPGTSVAPMPFGRGYVYSSSSSQLFFETLTGPGNPSAFSTRTPGGRTADLASVPLRTSMLVANADLNLLQVIQLDTLNSAYGTSVASANAGLTPVSVSVSALGNLAVTANAGDRSLSVFSLNGASPNIVAVVPSIARPGDQVSLYADNDFFSAGSEATLGGDAYPLVANEAGTGGTFVVPAIPSRETTVGVRQPPPGTASLTAPIRIVPPTRTPLLRSANFSESLNELPCVGALSGDLIEVSPDGKQLAVVMNTNLCESRVAFYDITDDGPRGFAVKDTSILGTTGDIIDDIEYSSDSKRLLLSTPDGFLKIFNTDRSSPTYSSLITLLSIPTIGAPYGIACDPMGRRNYGSGRTGEGITVLDAVTNAVAFTIPIPGRTLALKTSANGRYLIAGGDGVVTFRDLSTATTVATTATHSGAVTQLALTTDGRRVVAIFTGSNAVGVYNLDPTAGAIGAEVFFGMPIGMPALPTRMCAGGDGHSLLMVEGPHVWMVDVNGGANATLALTLPFSPGAIGTSRDGRSVWVTENTTVAPPAPPWPQPILHRYQLSDATAMSLVAGAAQGAAPGATLPTPVRVRLVDANGRPEPGVQVRFTLPDATHGSLDFRGGNTNRVKLTDTNGEAAVVWTLSPSSVANPLISVSAPILGSAPIVVGALATQDDAQILPAITDVGPSNGASGINTGTELVVRFNQRMTLASVSQTVTLTVNGTARAGTYRSEQGGRDIFFRPTSALPFNSECVFTIAPGAVDAEGQALAVGATSTFRTEPQPSLSLTAITPPAAATGASLVLSGSGFNAVPALNTVVLNGKIAPVLSASNASLVVRVPQDATSGEVVVQTGGNSTNPVNFIVLAPDTTVGGKLADLPGDGGLRAIAITPDGARAYATNSLTNTVSALDLQNVATLGTFSVGLEPVAITILPSGTRAYIANHGSNDVSVFGTLPTALDYHSVLKTIPVGKQPTAIATTPDGRFVVVVCEGDSTLRWIDSNPSSGTADLVVTTATALPGGKGVIISPDGTRAFVATSTGVVVIDLATRSVSTTVSIASGTKGVAITPDGTIVLALTNNGLIVVIDVVPGSTTQYRVVTTATASAGGKGVIVSPDGTLCYVIDGTGGSLQAFIITNSSSGQNVAYVPGARVTLTPSNSITTGAGASGIAIDPTTGLILVTNSTAGTISFIGDPTLLGCVPVAFQFNPGSLNLKSNGKWVKGTLKPVAPLRPEDIDVASIRLMGSVAVDPNAPVSLTGCPTSTGMGEVGGPLTGASCTGLEVRFLRSEVELAVQAGDAVPVTVSGVIGGRTLCGADTIKVKRGRVITPVAAQSAQPNTVLPITWETPKGSGIKYVMLTATYDGGRTWNALTSGISNTGKWDWIVPAQMTDSAQVAVLWVEDDKDLVAHPADPELQGTVAVSARFRINGVTAVDDAPPVSLSFARPTPNPVTTGRALLRFGLPHASEVSLDLFDVSGRHLSTLAKGRHDAGWHEVKWSGAIDGGGRARPGLYWARLRVNGSELRQTLVWMK